MKALIPRVFWLFPSSCWLEQLEDLVQNMDECFGKRCFSQIILITSSKFRDREGSPFCTLFMMPSIQSSKTEIWVHFMPATREQPKWHPVLCRASGDKLSNGHLCSKRKLLYSMWYSITILSYMFDDFHWNSPQTDATGTIYLSGKQASLTNPETDSWDLNHF